ncbi:MJ1255/VC2487 family glycosyltransferase [Pseudomaricurvus sp.]|uniref:MJ1255/VC2487 family glycosyltransferase n=1 Tax=Pseudomaricurvus sp. TaxID=2004510 RepID=UPI003F6C110D
MKLFYGVQGTGNGHISRARAMNTHLQAANVDVQYLFSGRARDEYFDMAPFGQWECRQGLSFVTHKGQIQTLATFRQNNFTQLYRDIRELDLSGYDLVICDFEPITAWAAKRQGIPCITLGHQYAFMHDVPMDGDSWLSKKIIQHFAPGHQQLGLHWHHFGQPILPPIIDLSITPPKDTADQVLVYLGFESPEVVIPLLKQFPDTQFVYYGKFKEPREENNVSLRPLSLTGFKEDLHRSSGVICNAGFELASEALHLGKRLLVKPLHGQMEQLSNALALEELDLGSRMQHLSKDTIRQWLDSPASPQCHYPDVSKAIVDWLTTPDREPIESLSKRLWRETKLVGRTQNTSPQKQSASAYEHIRDAMPAT